MFRMHKSKRLSFKDTPTQGAIMQEKAIVKLDSDGDIVGCAKGLEMSECGYKPGAKACGKCGAMAVMAKGDMNEDMDEDMEDEEEMLPMKKRMQAMDMSETEDEDMDEEEMDMPVIGAKKKMGMGAWDEMTPKKKRKAVAVPEMDDEDEEEVPAPPKKRMMSSMGAEEEVEEEDDEMEMDAMRKKMRMRRMNSMGFKSADTDVENIFMCQFERKVYPINGSVCDSCPGGCMPEGSMPGILEVEGMAEEMFSGKVLDSGYSDDADLFIVDLERKDGKPIEIFFDGETAEVMGWHMLSNDVLNVKSGLQNQSLISFSEAAEIATKSVFGDVVAVEPDVFEGFDAYAVEVEGLDGKSYDVFISLDGELLGYDEYTLDEAESLEAEAAEIALKRAYSEDSRMEMAKKGDALPDGSYPIKDESDLRNAIQAFGRAKDKDAAKAHIMKRAVDMGLEDLIPTNWVPSSDQQKARTEEKSEEESFLNDLLEFEMLSAEQGTDKENL
jgi:uncharacterized membrane protein YkoI